MIKPFCYSRLDLLVNNCVLNIVKHLCKIEVIGRGHIRKIPIFFKHGTNCYHVVSNIIPYPLLFIRMNVLWLSLLAIAMKSTRVDVAFVLNISLGSSNNDLLLFRHYKPPPQI